LGRELRSWNHLSGIISIYPLVFGEEFRTEVGDIGGLDIFSLIADERGLNGVKDQGGNEDF
jgi:hypothetical protein